MVKHCVVCGNVGAFVDVSVHKYLQFNLTHNNNTVTCSLYNITFTFRIPTDARRIQWVEFVANQGFVLNLSSKLCSRHFVPGLDYAVRDAQRRRLLPTAVPSLVSKYHNS